MAFLRNVFAARRQISIEEVLSIIEPRAEWMQLARQCAFFMTPTYQKYFEPSANHFIDPNSTFEILYGPAVKVGSMFLSKIE